MKGTRHAPQCGFSATVVRILDELLIAYTTVDVLGSPEVREGIKEYSSWPTLPQLYIDGQFIGGADIVREMRDTGQLEVALGVTSPAPPPPKIAVTAAARKALLQAMAEEDDELHLEVDVGFEHMLYFAPRRASDIAVDAGGVVFLLDRASARRADGVSIDLVDGPDGLGFKLDNPNEPLRVGHVSLDEIAAMGERGDPILIFDLRDQNGPLDVVIPGSVPFNLAARKRLEDLDKATPIAFFCHHGSTSRWTAEHYLQQGFKRVFNVQLGHRPRR